MRGVSDGRAYAGSVPPMDGRGAHNSLRGSCRGAFNFDVEPILFCCAQHGASMVENILDLVDLHSLKQARDGRLQHASRAVQPV